jgi:hypothetical protein
MLTFQVAASVLQQKDKQTKPHNNNNNNKSKTQ